MKLESAQIEQEAVLHAARMMATAARTAPKGKGVDELVSLILTGEEKEQLAASMDAIGEAGNLPTFVRDAKNVRQSGAILLLGTAIKPRAVPHCGYCGYKDCAENEARGGRCAFCIGDLGLAVGSAVSLAADNRVDTRVLFSAGRIAMESGVFGPEIKLAFGIPISVSGKSIFFDRPVPR